MADLRTHLFGTELKTPLILSSGPLSATAKGISRALTAGASAVVTKTISQTTAIHPVPHIMTVGRNSLLNAEKWSDLTPEHWLKREFPALRDRDGVLIASLGHSVADVEALAALVVAAGTDMLEVVSYRAEDIVPMIGAAKRHTDVPVLAKISPNWPDLLGVVDDCVTAGADGITATDSLGPVLAIDIETKQPLLGSAGGAGWLSGSAIRPLAVRIVADICRRHSIPVIATGGVSRTEDVVEMLMVGAAAVGVHTAPLLRGLDWFKVTAKQLSEWLTTHGYASVDDVRGVALPHLGESEMTMRREFVYVPEKCDECRRCVTVCAYQARALADKTMRLDGEQCRQCGLCVAICSTGALSFV